ncbi:E3 ubiquitin-protein ligase [Porphyridium purpureum]|uniref:E3 ubiquitin-protein ligase n=1 Tax=Porphyridium purpureum TaxID=35688 RepID=A0A5J4Z0M2_PORPP|nr:E3 ubiquitin-protein ligase [Porphyridium purpureum]|eukprot:POR4704..scf208_2
MRRMVSSGRDSTVHTPVSMLYPQHDSVSNGQQVRGSVAAQNRFAHFETMAQAGQAQYSSSPFGSSSHSGPVAGGLNRVLTETRNVLAHPVQRVMNRPAYEQRQFEEAMGRAMEEFVRNATQQQQQQHHAYRRASSRRGQAATFDPSSASPASPSEYRAEGSRWPVPGSTSTAVSSSLVQLGIIILSLSSLVGVLLASQKPDMPGMSSFFFGLSISLSVGCAWAASSEEKRAYLRHLAARFAHLVHSFALLFERRMHEHQHPFPPTFQIDLNNYESLLALDDETDNGARHSRDQESRAQLVSERTRRFETYPLFPFAHGSESDGGGARCCAVCLDDFQEQQNVRILPCMHVYCDTCIRTWYVSHGNCPVCKTDFG